MLRSFSKSTLAVNYFISGFGVFSISTSSSLNVKRATCVFCWVQYVRFDFVLVSDDRSVERQNYYQLSTFLMFCCCFSISVSLIFGLKPVDFFSFSHRSRK